MPKIVKIHGCSGAGKTTVARALMAMSMSIRAVKEDDRSNKPEAYVCGIAGLSHPLAILGSYENNCGGMDTYSSAAPDIVKLIDGYKDHCHVVFEGLLLSTYYGAVGWHCQQSGDDFIMAFMDTPIDVCLARIEARRAEQGSKNKFNPQNTIDKWHTIARLRDKSKLNGRRVIELNHADPLIAVGQITAILEDAS